MGVLRDPLHRASRSPAPPAAPNTEATGKSPKYNRRASDGGHEDSRHFPAQDWPVATRPQRIALLDAITDALRAGRLDRVGAYHERLRWAFRCMEENV